jgi:hypothetical protein
VPLHTCIYDAQSQWSQGSSPQGGEVQQENLLQVLNARTAPQPACRLTFETKISPLHENLRYKSLLRSLPAIRDLNDFMMRQRPVFLPDLSGGDQDSWCF